MKPKATMLQGAVVQLFWLLVPVFPNACANDPEFETPLAPPFICPLLVLPPLDARL